ncbi:MAG: AbrB/MazE/SpoVT family DNA-binding domain-containing protein [Chloroflexota bacterium]|nr:AbrB/MazE/SpoVT family DNA-binding domain-containing protein [Chloroflexota bacterium]MDE2969195.1 AbrB/MazE/SpoVT family DNA-binding domain-containing protein [Chloroflexota bacterium]
MDQPSYTREVKLIPIGNSKGIRLPKALLDKYGWSDRLVLEEMEESVVLRSEARHALSWEETSRAMAAEAEDWSDFDTAIADGLD